MYRTHAYNPPRRGLKLLGWATLLLGLPVALLGAMMAPNEYKATLGINALDCDGPFGVYLITVPALLLYGSGLLINGIRWRRRVNLIVAVMCAMVCAAVGTNFARAVAEDRVQAAACESR